MLRTKARTVYKLDCQQEASSSSTYITNRAADVLLLQTFYAKEIVGNDPSEHSFNWDLSQNITYTFHKHPSAACFYGTILRSHIYWNTRLGRPRIAFEHLLAQGFPSWINIGHGTEDALSETELRGIAGDTINVGNWSTSHGSFYVSRGLQLR